MEKHPNPIDDFLKESLKGHRLTPRQESRKTFLEEAATIIPGRKTWPRWYYLPVILIFIAGAIFIFYYTYQDNRIQTVAPEAVTVIPEKSKEPAIVPEMKAAISPDEKHVYAENAQPVSNDHKEMTGIAEKAEKQAAQPEESKPEHEFTETPVTISHEPVPEPIKSGNDEKENVTDPVPVSIAKNIDTVIFKEDAVYDQPATSDTLPGLKEEYPEATSSRSVFHLGLSYTPEVMFNTCEGNKYISNAGIEVAFYKGRVSLRTGAGISVSKGTTENSVEYNSYLGAYNHLDSITFSYNENYGDFIPKLYLSEEKVWDKESSYDSIDIIKRYTYLQIPLAIGFDFWQNGKFSAGVRVGTIMSVMLSAKQLTGTYDPGENQFIGMNNITPDRVSMNWQATGGISFTAVLSRRIALEVEPQAKYYYGSIYEKSGNVPKPWSISIRTALYYKF